MVFFLFTLYHFTFKISHFTPNFIKTTMLYSPKSLDQKHFGFFSFNWSKGSSLSSPLLTWTLNGWGLTYYTSCLYIKWTRYLYRTYDLWYFKIESIEWTVHGLDHCQTIWTNDWTIELFDFLWTDQLLLDKKHARFFYLFNWSKSSPLYGPLLAWTLNG